MKNKIILILILLLAAFIGNLSAIWLVRQYDAACARGNLPNAEKGAFWKFGNRMVEK